VSNDIGHWCRFFLQAIIDTALNGKDTFEKILALRRELDAAVFRLGRRAENAQQLIRHLYGNPVVSVSMVEHILGINNNPARELIKSLEQINVLEEVTGFKRNRLFIFRRYMNIFRDHKVLTQDSGLVE